MVEFIHGELSFKIIGLLYGLHNVMGGGFQEKYYQRALAKVFAKNKIPFVEQQREEIQIDGESIGRYFMDFVIDKKIVLEIKAKPFISLGDVKQLLNYLKTTGYEVGLLAAFGPDRLIIKRVLKGY